MSDEEFADITPAPKSGPLKLKDVQAHPELLGQPDTPKAAKPVEPVVMPPDAPWYQCWNVEEAHPNDGTTYSVEGGQGREVRTAELHPPFQSTADVTRNVHPTCPVCGRHTVMPLENYAPAVPA